MSDPDKKQSPRGLAQQKIVDALLQRMDRYDAPYGILAGMMPLEKGGYVRTVTFGCSRTLDAVFYVWGPNSITIRSEGVLAVAGRFKFDGHMTMEQAMEMIAQFDKREETSEDGKESKAEEA